MPDDFTPLTSCNHYLGWLGDDPAQAVRSEIERLLQEQVPTASLEWIRLTATPEFLTGGRKAPDDPGKLILTRAALAVAFELQVCSEGRVDELSGVFSWVAAGLDGERRDRLHFDLNADLAWAATKLKARIYEIDAPAS
jgi:hypothetical protein